MSSIPRLASLSRTRLIPRTALASTRSYATRNTEEIDPQLNGYPQLPNISRQTFSPYGWTDPQMRRNFGEPLHEKDELYGMWGPDPSPLGISPQNALLQLTFALSCFGTFILFIKEFGTPEKPAVSRTYPYSGLIRELGGLEETKARPYEEAGEDVE